MECQRSAPTTGLAVRRTTVPTFPTSPRRRPRPRRRRATTPPSAPGLSALAPGSRSKQKQQQYTQTLKPAPFGGRAFFYVGGGPAGLWGIISFEDCDLEGLVCL